MSKLNKYLAAMADVPVPDNAIAQKPVHPGQSAKKPRITRLSADIAKARFVEDGTVTRRRAEAFEQIYKRVEQFCGDKHACMFEQDTGGLRIFVIAQCDLQRKTPYGLLYSAPFSKKHNRTTFITVAPGRDEPLLFHALPVAAASFLADLRDMAARSDDEMAAREAAESGQVQ